MPRPGFSLFVEQVLYLYESVRRETDMRRVIVRCKGVISQPKPYQPVDDDEEINIETATELFEELLERAEVRLKLGR